jgi:hypothetical protein
MTDDGLRKTLHRYRAERAALCCFDQSGEQYGIDAAFA